MNIYEMGSMGGDINLSKITATENDVSAMKEFCNSSGEIIPGHLNDYRDGGYLGSSDVQFTGSSMIVYPDREAIVNDTTAVGTDINFGHTPPDKVMEGFGYVNGYGYQVGTYVPTQIRKYGSVSSYSGSASQALFALSWNIPDFQELTIDNLIVVPKTTWGKSSSSSYQININFAYDPSTGTLTMTNPTGFPQC